MFSQLSNNSKGIILAIIGFSAFALSDANAKFLTQHYPPTQVVGIVALFSSSLCVALSPWMGGLKKTLQTKKLKFHLWRGLMNTLCSLLIVYSFSRFSLAGTYTMVFAAPFIVAIIARIFFKENIHPHGWMAIIAGFCGVVIAVRPGAEDFDPLLFIPLLSALSVALLLILARNFGRDETLTSLSFYSVFSNLLLISLPVLWIYGLPQTGHLWHFALQAVGVLVGLSCTALAFRLAKASVVGPFLYLEMVWAIGFDYFMFKTAPDLWMLAGAVIIISSGIYLIESERRIAGRISIP